MDTIWLPDAKARPRRLAVGEFDGVHAGHREVIARRRQRADVRAAPAHRGRARVRAEAADHARAEGRPDRRARRRRADRDPVRRRADAADRAGVHRPRADRAARRDVGLGRRELPLRPPRAGRRGAAGDQNAFKTRVVELVEVDGEIVSSTHIRGLVATGAVAEAARLLGAPFGMRGIVAARRQARPHARLPDRQPRARPGAGGARPRHLRLPRGGPGLGEWTAAVSIGVRPTFVTGRGLLVEAFLLDFDGDLYGRELRLRLRRPHPRRAALRVRRVPDRADAAATWSEIARLV